MVEELLYNAFEKAGVEIERDSLNARAEHIADYIRDACHYPISAKSLTRYYKNETEPNLQVKNALAVYLGYQTYQDFIKEEVVSEKDKDQDTMKFLKLPWKTQMIILVLLPVFLGSGYLGFRAGREECMIWQDDHYEKQRCSGSQDEVAFSNYLMENFKQIKVSDTTTFFDKGEPRVWYDKISSEKIEYFSAPGINPKTKHTLKAITPYMIHKYILSDSSE